MFEKRRYQRLAVQFPVTVRCQGRLLPATMVNLSCGGACVRVEGGPIGAAAPVEVIFDLDGGLRDISMRGNIIYSTAEGAQTDTSLSGIRFNAYSAGHKVVQDFLQKNLN